MFYLRQTNFIPFQRVLKATSLDLLSSLLFRVSSYLSLYSFLIFLLVSCGDFPEQYSDRNKSFDPTQTTLTERRWAIEEPTPVFRAQGSYNKLERSEEEKDRQTRANSLQPINYSTGFAGNISLETTYDESLEILNPVIFIDRIGLGIYKEGLTVRWRRDPPLVPIMIVIRNGYQGEIDLGPEVRKGKIGDSFVQHFDLSEEDIQKDKLALQFIRSLYRHFEQTDEDCLQTKKCRISKNIKGDYIMFELPKMNLEFGNNKRRKLVRISLARNIRSDCFERAFDLLRSGFYCKDKDQENSLAFVGFGNLYQEIAQISELSDDLLILYGKSLFIHQLKEVSVGFYRSDFGEKPPSVPAGSPFSYIKINNAYRLPLLLDQSLIKVEINSSDDSVQLNLVPLLSTTAQGIQEEIQQKQEEIQEEIEKKQKRIQEELQQKQEEIQKEESNAFYFSTVMPSIKNNRKAQQNLIQALFDILEVKMKETYPEENIKIYKRIYGKYNDSDLSKARGLLTAVFSSSSGEPIRLEVSISEHSGQAIITQYRIHSPFEEYVARSQKPLRLTSDGGRELAGFSLGDKIYLRNKDRGKGEAEAVYLAPSLQAINTLGTWNEDLEMSVLYEDGGERILSWQRSEFFSSGGMSFAIQPLSQEKEIEGKLYNVYEINGLVATSEAFFEPISRLCLIEGFDVWPGIFDNFFESELEWQITQAKKQSGGEITEDDSTIREQYESCPYVVPQDKRFAGLRSVYFFPRHRLSISFKNREFSSIKIYKRAGENPSSRGQ